MIRGSSLSAEFNKNKIDDKKRLAKLTWPKCYADPVDVSKIDIKRLSDWIDQKTADVLGFDDDVLTGTIKNSLTEESGIDPRVLHTTIEPFLGEHTPSFMKELWGKLLNPDANGLLVVDPKHIQGVEEDFLSKSEKQRAKSNRNRIQEQQTTNVQVDTSSSVDDHRAMNPHLYLHASSVERRKHSTPAASSLHARRNSSNRYHRRRSTSSSSSSSSEYSQRRTQRNERRKRRRKNYYSERSSSGDTNSRRHSSSG